MILCIENPKLYFKKLLELISSLWLQDTNSVYKNQLHLYTLIISEREIKKKFPFTIVPPKILEIHLAKLGDLYTENYNTLMKEIEDNINKWKDTLCS